MAAFTITNTAVLVGSVNLGQFAATVGTDETVTMLEVPVVGGGGFMRRIPGRKLFAHSYSGYADFVPGGPSVAFTPASLGAHQAVTLLPDGGGATVGDVAIFTRGRLGAFTPFGGGENAAATFSMDLEADTAQVHGALLHPITLARTATGNGTAVQRTGPSANQRVYAGLHVLAASGTTPSLTVRLQSDDNSGMTSPTDRITFTGATAAGWQFSSAAGAITDSWWRATWTISGTTPSFTFAVVFGVY